MKKKKETLNERPAMRRRRRRRRRGRSVASSLHQYKTPSLLAFQLNCVLKASKKCRNLDEYQSVSPVTGFLILCYFASRRFSVTFLPYTRYITVCVCVQCTTNVRTTVRHPSDCRLYLFQNVAFPFSTWSCDALCTGVRVTHTHGEVESE